MGYQQVRRPVGGSNLEAVRDAVRAVRWDMPLVEREPLTRDFFEFESNGWCIRMANVTMKRSDDGTDVILSGDVLSMYRTQDIDEFMQEQGEPDLVQ